MRNLVIMPTEKRTLNLDEYAEEATIIVEETATPKRVSLRQTPKKLPCNI
jgi:hypothetical protein